VKCGKYKLFWVFFQSELTPQIRTFAFDY